MGNMPDTGNDPTAQEPLPSDGAESSSDSAALPAAEKAIDSEINEGARIPAPAIPLHPLARIVPMRDDASIRGLARQIAGDVPLDPIILFEDQVLDRWELYLAGLEAGREPTFETYVGDNPLAFLIDRQLQRGYLDESQRGMLAARVCNFPVGGNQYSQGLSIGRASELLKVSSETISRAKKVLARGIPELVKAVDDGVLKVWKAYTIAKKQPQQQREELARLLAADSPVGRTSAGENHNPPVVGSRETPQAVQGESGVADGDGSVDSELREAGPQGGDQRQVASNSTAAPGAPSSASAAGTESSPRMPLYKNDEWIWPGYIPFPGVTAIVGSVAAPISLVAAKVAATVSSGGWSWPDYRCGRGGEGVWLTAQHGVSRAIRDRLAAAGVAFEFDFGPVQIIEPERDMFGLPIHDLHRDLDRLERDISNTDKVRIAVIDYVSPYLGEDVEPAIRDFRGAFEALKDFAAKVGVAVILPCRLPCHGGSRMITRAIDALSVIPGVDSVLLVEGTARGTVVPKKTWAGLDAKAVAFRTSKKPGCFDSAIVWESSIPTKSAAKDEPYTMESLANREIANTSNPDVSHESSSAGVVPAQSDEIPATPSRPSTAPEMASANSTEGAAAIRETIAQSLRPGASANVGKPVVGLTKPLGRKPTVPVPPFYSKPAGARPAPFRSAAPEEADEKPRRANSAFGGKQSVGLRQGAPTKLASKVRKLEERNLHSRKQANGKNKKKIDPSDWW